MTLAIDSMTSYGIAWLGSSQSPQCKMELKSMLNIMTLERPVIQGPSGAETPRITDEAQSTDYGTLPRSSTPIRVVPRMPKTIRTIGYASRQYEVSAGVEEIVKKAGGMWTYMNGKYFPSKGRTKQNEANLVKAGLIAVCSDRSKKVVLMLEKELKTLLG